MEEKIKKPRKSRAKSKAPVAIHYKTPGASPGLRETMLDTSAWGTITFMEQYSPAYREQLKNSFAKHVARMTGGAEEMPRLHVRP